MMRAHKIEMVPTPEPAIYFRKACGTARFTDNWGLPRWNERPAAGEKPHVFALKKELNALKSEQFPWMYEVTKCAPEAALADLGNAFANYFRDLQRTGGRRAKRPTFKKRGRCRDSFSVSNDQFVIEGRQIRLPHIGFVRLRESLRFDGRILGASVSREADRWFVAVPVDVEDVPIQRQNQAPVGIDLGILPAVPLSTGKHCDAPKSLAKNLRKLRRLSRRLSRKQKGSRNRKKATMQVARLHRRIANIRLDWTHKLTTTLTRRYGVIGLEDLAVGNLLHNRHLARAIADVGLGEMRRQFEYKAPAHGGQVVFVGRFFPSSKTCRKCGTQNNLLTLAERTFVCSACRYTEDRDRHASRNILREGLRVIKTTEGPSGSDACGQVASTKRSRFASRLVEAGRAQARGKTPKESSGREYV